jgi:hypothetical protein
MEGRGGFKESGDFRVSTTFSLIPHPFTNSAKFREGHYFWKQPLSNGSHRAMIHELTRTMVRMEKNQNFRQGNHRTAVLSLLDYLASVGIEYVKDPIHLYLNLAQSSHPDLSEKKDLPDFINRLADQVQSGSRKAPAWGVTAAKRLKYAERIKFAGRWHHVRRVNQIEEENALHRVFEAQRRYGTSSKEAAEAGQALRTLKMNAIENERLWSPKPGNEW